MSDTPFTALVIDQQDGKSVASFKKIATSDLPEGDVLVAVDYSCLNFKDGLAITGKGKIAKSFPMVPGIDFAGRVEQSNAPEFKPGDAVILTGWGVGEKHWGGYAEKARVKAEWLVPLPAGMTPRQVMEFGTAGLTAMLCVNALERHGIDRTREVLVTGAGGGVGSVATALLSRLGYSVTALVGLAEQADYVRSLGAKSVITREDFQGAGKPLLAERWGGVVDTVGSQTLATALAGVAYGGAVAACGLAGGADLPTTVMPFILRNVHLLGVDSVYCPKQTRLAAWERLGELLPTGLPGSVVEEVPLADIAHKAEAITEGRVKGRVVVRVH